MFNSRFSEISFAARSNRDVRREMLRILAADLAHDAVDGLLQDDGVMRHGVYINGRHVGYQARVAEGRARLDYLAALDSHVHTRCMRSTAELRARLDDSYRGRPGGRPVMTLAEAAAYRASEAAL